MAGYQCAFCDTEQAAVFIHQCLQPVNVIGTCRDHDALYAIGSIAQQLGIDPDVLYEQVYTLQQDAQEAARPPAPPEQETASALEVIEHYALLLTSDGCQAVDLCRCARGVNHDQTGRDVTDVTPDGIISVACPFCESVVFGKDAGLARNLTSHARSQHEGFDGIFTWQGMDGDTPVISLSPPPTAGDQQAAQEAAQEAAQAAASAADSDGTA